jgi:TAT (twin-arginine translocation) pathway signal sequence
VNVTRRNFLKSAASAAAVAIPTSSLGSRVEHAPRLGTASHGIDLLRRPDYVSARLGARDVVKLQYSAGAWTCPGIRVSADPTQAGAHSELPVHMSNEGRDLTYLHLRWDGRNSEGLLSIGDHGREATEILSGGVQSPSG